MGRVWTKEHRTAPINTKQKRLLTWGGDSGYELDGTDIIWLDVTNPISLDLRYKDFERGRSAIVFWWEDVTSGILYPMFPSDLSELLQNGIINGNILKGSFSVVKKGANYGIQLFKKDKQWLKRHLS